jgi:hypothetical protein
MKDSTINNRAHLNSDALTSHAQPQQGLSSQAGMYYLPGCTAVPLLYAIKLSPLDKMMKITQAIDAALKILGESSEDFDDDDEEDVAADVSPSFLLRRPPKS